MITRTDGDTKKKELITSYCEAVTRGSAAMFVGAGLSAEAGYPTWKQLLEDVARSLKIDLDAETDLVGVAQFYVNSVRSGRKKLEQRVHDTFTERKCIPETLRSIARLPLHSVWTTNYDDLIERAFAKKPTVRWSQKQLKEKRDGATVLYKMHGDAQNVGDGIVITRDDYEAYEKDRRGFMEVLASDYMERTFLFVGLSFTDPNMYHVLRLIRSIFPAGGPTHFALMRRPHPDESSAPRDHAQKIRRFDLWVADMARYGVNVVPIDEYAEVGAILDEIKTRYLRQTVFVSGSQGSQRKGTPEGKRLARLCREIGIRLARTGKRIVSKYRTTVGSALVEGFVQGLYETKDGDDPRFGIDRRMVIRPMKRPHGAGWAFNTGESRSLVSQAGICLVIGGGPGTNEDVKEAMESGCSVIAIPGTGGSADHMLRTILKHAAQNDTIQGRRDVECMERLAAIGFSLRDPKADAKILAVVTELEKYLADER